MSGKDVAAPEITPEMLEAGWEAYMGFDQESDSCTQMIKAVYSAMKKMEKHQESR